MNSRAIAWDILNENYITQHTNDEEDDDDDDDDDVSGGIQSITITPFGAFKVDSKMNPFNDRLVFSGNTTFKITEDEVNKIQEIDGVEALKIISPYALIVMIGTLFEPEEVLKEVNLALEAVDLAMKMLEDDEKSVAEDELDNVLEVSEELEAIVNEAIDTVSKSSDHWILYVFPNGKYWTEVFDTEEAMEVSFNDFIDGRIKMTDYSEGLLFNSKERETQ